MTLATPFIHARRRAFAGWSLFVLPLGCVLVIGSASSALAGGPHWRDWAYWAVLAVVAVPALAVLLCIGGAVMHWGLIGPGYRSQLIASAQSPQVEPEDVVVVRAAGDEASAILAAGQFLGWISALPFGWDGPFLSIFAFCSAEAAPPGQATILQLEPFAGAEKRGLAHSRLYESDPVISKIVTLICGSPPAKEPVEPPGSPEDRTRPAGQPGAP